jgi:hypothetical protein
MNTTTLKERRPADIAKELVLPVDDHHFENLQDSPYASDISDGGLIAPRYSPKP